MKLPVTGSEDEVRERRRGNIGVIVSILSLCFVFMLQFGGSIWWGATLSSDVRHVNDQLIRMDNERYTKTDAQRDVLRLDQHNLITNEAVNELRTRVERLEAQSMGTAHAKRR